MIGVMIFNAINVIVWGILSWHFDSWWLMFFALLFIQTYKESIKHNDDADAIRGIVTETERNTLDRVLEIISQERDKTENVTHKTIENIISAVLALQGGTYNGN